MRTAVRLTLAINILIFVGRFAIYAIPIGGMPNSAERIVDDWWLVSTPVAMTGFIAIATRSALRKELRGLWIDVSLAMVWLLACWTIFEAAGALFA